MYEPMKQVALRFPKWLDENRQSLSKQEMQQYVQMSSDSVCVGNSSLSSRVRHLVLLDESDSASASRSSFMCMR
jgi:hypothetical protein